MGRFRELLARLDSYAVGAAIGVMALAMPDHLADLVSVADQGTALALLGRMWDAFSQLVVPTSIGAGVGFWLLRRFRGRFRPASAGRSMLAGLLTTALLVSLIKLAGLENIGLRTWMHYAFQYGFFAATGLVGVLIAHSRMSRSVRESPAVVTSE